MPTARELQRSRAERFLALHRSPQILILPNAWDVSSAKVFELEGFDAIGTTSAGVAATLGYPDGQRMALADTLQALRRIVRHVDLPVSADIEAGYATTIEGVVRSARQVLEAGAVGLNLEDGTGDPSRPLYAIHEQEKKIAAIREMAAAEDIPLVVNARTDVYLVPHGSPDERLRRAVERARAYREAGADCIFVPDTGALDARTIVRLVEEIDGPVNIIAGATTPPIAELEKVGVARVSLGPRAMRATLSLLKKIARELLDRGTYDHMASSITYAEVNGWFERPSGPPLS